MIWRSQMQGGKNWILPKEINANRFFETLIGGKSLYGTEWRERGYGLGRNCLLGHAICTSIFGLEIERK
jgi:hypothetical protein